jgi:hypothetical protein
MPLCPVIRRKGLHLAGGGKNFPRLPRVNKPMITSRRGISSKKGEEKKRRGRRGTEY